MKFWSIRTSPPLRSSATAERATSITKSATKATVHILKIVVVIARKAGVVEYIGFLKIHQRVDYFLLCHIACPMPVDQFGNVIRCRDGRTRVCNFGHAAHPPKATAARAAYFGVAMRSGLFSKSIVSPYAI